MKISKRLLIKWRKEALIEKEALRGILEGSIWDNLSESVKERRESANRILKLTQELLDQYLLKEGSKNEKIRI